jgi:cytochrome c biogenesis protein CcdA
MPQDQIDYKAVCRRVEEGVKKEKNTARWVLFAVSLSMMIIFTLLGWSIAGEAGILRQGEGIAAMFLITLAAFFGVLFHMIALSIDSKSGESSIRQRLIARELGEAMLNLYAEEEAETKRKRTMRLSADGELEEIADERAVEETELPSRRMNSSDGR